MKKIINIALVIMVFGICAQGCSKKDEQLVKEITARFFVFSATHEPIKTEKLEEDSEQKLIVLWHISKEDTLYKLLKEIPEENRMLDLSVEKVEIETPDGSKWETFFKAPWKILIELNEDTLKATFIASKQRNTNR